MSKKSLFFAFAVTAFFSFGEAKADYQLTLSDPSVAQYTPLGGSTFTFATAAASQTVVAGFPQTFNVINVGLPNLSGSGSGTVTLSQNFTITGSGSTPGSLSGTLTGTFTVNGALSSFTGTVTNLTGAAPLSIGTISYAPPSAGSQAGSVTAGNISFAISPNVVPEPASIAMVGLGLGTLGLVTARRRRAAK
ncbi:PEP-CTERM sorting domain-containing protein [Tundrisphaera sp. TA3]|uniref:PEP-CTERM sorting domain-containing protein n=1 Tax=Tundrisphaera sp. TA3 TaxID=3435775 RepID=UPI003EBF998E